MGVRAASAPTAEGLDEVVSKCLRLPKQNADRLRDVGMYLALMLDSANGDDVYAIEVSKPGNLRKQLEQSKRGRSAKLCIAILEETGEYVPQDYESAAVTLVNSLDLPVTCIAVISGVLGSWRVSLIVAANGSGEAQAVTAFAPHARVVSAGEKPSLRPVMPQEQPAMAPSERLLDDRLRRILLKMHTEMSAAGELKNPETVGRYYAAFRERFGPAALGALDGEALLETMHSHLNRQSLVYWIEFKNDSEFPAIFGSIAGGSAGKFGVYKRKENEAWAIQGKDRNPQEIPLNEAIEIARRHRDQLLQGAELLEALPANATKAEYIALEEELARVAPDVADSAWGHKYFHLLHPDKLDDFHVARYQQYHLLRLLQPEPITAGRYSSAWRYVAIARELGILLNHLTSILNRRHGAPRRYWRVGTSDGQSPGNRWELMRSASAVAIGWPLIGNIGPLREAGHPREGIKRLLGEHYPNTSAVTSRKAGEIVAFLTKMMDGDVVCASVGATVVGVGVVRGPYAHAASADFPHRRPVEWMTLKEWQLNTTEGNQTSVWEYKEYDNLLQIERVLLDAAAERAPQPLLPVPGTAVLAHTPAPPLSGTPRRIEEILERKGQVILYGPPGTGKTFFALETARELVARRVFGRVFSELTEAERSVIEGNDDAPGLVRTSTFHPEYGYEGFIEGYRPVLSEGRLAYELRDGVFKQLCDDARGDRTGRPHVIVVDEINRGDIPRIFGELLTLLERDKRGRSVRLPMSGSPFNVPRNVFVIGTMNTADRSIALLDVALRRRFGFIALMPDYSMLGKTVVAGLPLARWLKWVNARVRQVAGSDGRHREIGHGYFWSNGAPVSDAGVLAAILRDDIVPLLEEYCFEDLSQLAPILGDVVVDLEAQRVRYEVFDGDPEASIAALLAAAPELEEEDSLGIDDPDVVVSEMAAEGDDD